MDGEKGWGWVRWVGVVVGGIHRHSMLVFLVSRVYENTWVSAEMDYVHVMMFTFASCRAQRVYYYNVIGEDRVGLRNASCVVLFSPPPSPPGGGGEDIHTHTLTKGDVGLFSGTALSKIFQTFHENRVH